jgi:hypothetical protein
MSGVRTSEREDKISLVLSYRSLYRRHAEWNKAAAALSRSGEPYLNF